MDDLIKRQDAIDALEEPCKVPDTWTDEFAVGERMQWEKDVKTLNSLPSVQLERKRGKWIYYPKASGSVTSTAVHLYPVCSECGCEHPIANFCPNCGADMREGEKK